MEQPGRPSQPSEKDRMLEGVLRLCRREGTWDVRITLERMRTEVGRIVNLHCLLDDGLVQQDGDSFRVTDRLKEEHSLSWPDAPRSS